MQLNDLIDFLDLSTETSFRRTPPPVPADRGRSPVVASRKADRNNRILIIDDNEAIHQDYRKILTRRAEDGHLSRAMEGMFDDDPPASAEAELPVYELTHANQGKVGFELVRVAAEAGRPFAMAFVDMRMPPGWNGVETIKHIWQADSEIEIVLCTAYSDFRGRRSTSSSRRGGARSRPRAHLPRRRLGTRGAGRVQDHHHQGRVRRGQTP
jgi:CheY-like chemotaxis protein